MPAPTLYETLLQERIRPLRRALRGVRQGDVVAIHHARTATRRLRALLPLLALDPERARTVRRELQRAGRHMGRLRDLDTQLILLDELIGDAPKGRTVLAGVRREMVRTRRAAHARILAKKIDRKLDAVIVQLRLVSVPATVAGAATRDRALTRRAARQLRQGAGQLLSCIRDAGTTYDPALVHRVRIAIKKLRYVAELSERASSRPRPDDVAHLKRAQDVLGALHDTQVLLDTLRTVDTAAASVLRRRCRRLHARFLADRASLVRLVRLLGAPSSPAARKVG